MMFYYYGSGAQLRFRDLVIALLIALLLISVVGSSVDGAIDAQGARFCAANAIDVGCPGTSRMARLMQALPTYRLAYWLAEENSQ